MYSVELYSRVRRACYVDGMSNSAAARLFGIDRKTVAKILKHSVPPGYCREGPPARPKLDPFVAIIDQILADDMSRIKKQRKRDVVARTQVVLVIGCSTSDLDT